MTQIKNRISAAIKKIEAYLAAEKIETASMERKHNEVAGGSFVYYIIKRDTNIRRTKDGSPIMYSNVDVADYECEWVHERVISVAEYSHVFGGLEI